MQKKFAATIRSHIDSGNDDLFNRIIWFAANEKKPYPAKYCGKEDDDED